MYRTPPSLHPDGSGGAEAQRQQQQPIHFNPNFLPNLNLYLNPAFMSHISPYIQTPINFPFIQQQFLRNNFPFQPNATSTFQIPHPGHCTNNDSNFNKVPQQSDVQKEMIMKVDKAAASARHDLVASNKYVTAWEVSQEALLMVKAESWESLGFQMQQVPSLNRLLLIEGKINDFIHCFVAVRRITSLHDLEIAICESEGIKQFEELELGPLIRNPLAMHYFSVSSEVTEVYKIGSQEIISLLCEFMDINIRKEVEVDSFLDFISEKQSTDGKENLCLRIQNIGMYTSFIKLARQAEDTAVQNCLEKFKRKASRKSKKRPPFSAQKQLLDDNFNAISQRIKYFSSENTPYGGKHIRFVSCSSGDDVSEDTSDDNQDEMNTNINQIPFSKPNPYPSATEEKTRLGLKIGVACSPGTAVSGVTCNMYEQSERKRKPETMSSNTLPWKPSKKQNKYLGPAVSEVTCNMDEQPKRKRKPETMSSNTSLRKPSKNQKKYRAYIPKTLKDQCINDHSLSVESLELFVSPWKEACRESNLATSGTNMRFDLTDFSAPNTVNFSQPNSNDKDQLFGLQDALNTGRLGRLGELVAFKFLIGKYDNVFVNWVNQANETGLPYDIIIGDEDSREYIEVKATKTARKKWFFITMKEWQFALEKETSYSIAHVTFFDNMAKITIYKNPARLCELGNIKLAVVVPK